MGKWADLARQIREDKPCAKSANSVENRPNGTNGTNGTGSLVSLLSEERARATLHDWHARLSDLDVYNVPDGFDQQRWGMLVHDCWLIYENHASRLVRDGWSSMDLWAVLPTQRGWGGLADRLQGARNVLFDDQGKAYWTRLGVKFSASRGIGDALRGSDARLVWDCSARGL